MGPLQIVQPTALKNIGATNAMLRSKVAPFQGKFNSDILKSGLNIGGAINAIGSGVGLASDIYNNLQVGDINYADMNALTKGDLLSRANNFITQGGYDNQLGRTNVGMSALSSAGKGAAVGSMFGPVGTAVGGLVGAAGGLFSSIFGNSKKARKENEALKKTMNQFSSQNTWLNQQNISNWQSNQLAYGGILPMTQKVGDLLAMKGNNIFAYGGDFSNGVNHFNAGGTHDNNPMGGIPVGMGENGQPNLVEEGEVKWNDYIFSDRLEVIKPEDFLLANYLNKKTFADAALDIAKESEERPNDPISKRGLYDGLGKLMAMQEMIKMQEEGMDTNMFATGGDLNPEPKKFDILFGQQWGNIWNPKDLKQDNTQKEATKEAPKEELDIKVQLENAYRNAGITNEDMIKNLVAQDEFESLLKPQGKNNFSNITKGSSWKGKTVEGKDRDAKGNKITQSFREYDSIDDYAKDKLDLLTRLYDFNQNDSKEEFAAKLDGNNKDKRRWAEDVDYGKKMVNVFKGDFNQMPSSYREDYESRKSKFDSDNKVASEKVEATSKYAKSISNVNPIGLNNMIQGLNYSVPTSSQAATPTPNPASNPTTNNAPKEFYRQNQFDETLRYSPLFAQLGVLGDVISNRSDNIQLGRISPQPVSERLTYNPIDDEYVANKVRQQGAGLYRGIVDSSMGNRGIAQAGMLAASRGINDSIGDAYFKSREYNSNERSRVMDFNRATSIFNAEQDLKGQIFNTEAFNKEVDWNKQAEAARRNMIRQGISTIGNTLGAIGTENMFFNMAPTLSQGYDYRGRYLLDSAKALGGEIKFYKKKIK